MFSVHLMAHALGGYFPKQIKKLISVWYNMSGRGKEFQRNHHSLHNNQTGYPGTKNPSWLNCLHFSLNSRIAK